MDPTIALHNARQTYKDGDLELANDIARGLIDWLDKGGFPPEGFSKIECRALLTLFVID